MGFRVKVDYDLCESNAICMQVAPEVFEVRDDLIHSWKSKIVDLMMYPRLLEDNGSKFKIKIDIDICKWWDSCDKDDDYSWDLCEKNGKLETCK